MKTKTLLAATLAAVLLAGCSDETVNMFVPAESQIIATAADSLAQPVTDNWNEPSLYSINAIKSRHVNHLQAFRCTDGAGLLAWDTSRNKSYVFFAYFGPDGSMMPAVEILGDFQDRGFVGMSDMVVVWTPSGDAVIAFRAEQADDPENDLDSESDRVYYTWFRRALAATPIGPNGEIYGFRQWAEVVDTDTTEDERYPQRIFVATNLADGTLEIDTSNDEPSPLSEICTGGRGDTCNGEPFIYLGWIQTGGTTIGSRLAGGFVDLDTLRFSHADVSLIDFSPAAESTDRVDFWSVATSGRDISFLWRDYLDAQQTRFQTRLNLVRVNDTRDGLDPTVDVTRGTQTSDQSFISDYYLIGNGYRVLNGSDATWFVVVQNQFTSATVSNADTDLILAQVDDTGNVEIGEFDHNPADAPDANGLDMWELEIGRGATRAFVYYGQDNDVTGQTIANNDSLFARALRLDADASLTDNVSNEVRVNTTIDTTISRSTNVWDYYLAGIDPFCSPQSNNDVSCVVFKQWLEPANGGGTNQDFQVAYGRVAITDINANPIAITSTESVVFPTLDSSIWANDPYNIPPVLMPAGTASGDCIVFLTANGNHRDDGSDPDFFEEPRVFAFAPMLPDGQSLVGAVEIGSNNPAGPTVGFADYASIDLSNRGVDDVHNVMAVSTPNAPAARDCRFSDDLANPDFVHVFFFEYLRDLDDSKQTIWRSRALDLRADSFAAGVNRFAPLLGQPPANIGTGSNATIFEQMQTEDFRDYPAQLADNGGGIYGPYFDGASQRNDLFVAFNEVFGGKGSPGFIYCNTFNPQTVRWARPALLSNDYPGPIASHGAPDMIFVPGVDAAGCDRIVGGWVFWMRSIFQPEQEENDVDLLQGRRLYATRMQ